MENNYLLVHKKILPDYYEKVIEAREMLKNHEVKTVTEAVKKVGISRNTYYKYKDFLFTQKDEIHHEIILSLVLSHEPGTLSTVLKTLSSFNASIITISQSNPLVGKASITISLDTSKMKGTTKQLVSSLKKLKPVLSIHLDAEE